MPDDADLVELERAGWNALSAGGDAATAFYGDLLADEVVFLFPDGLVLDDRAAVIESMGGVAWDEYALSDERVVALGDDAAAVVYRADARRGGDPYGARCTSTYIRTEGAVAVADAPADALIRRDRSAASAGHESMASP